MDTRIEAVFILSLITLFAVLWLVAGADLLWEKSTADWLVAAGWCWFGIREKHYWLNAANRVYMEASKSHLMQMNKIKQQAEEISELTRNHNLSWHMITLSPYRSSEQPV